MPAVTPGLTIGQVRRGSDGFIFSTDRDDAPAAFSVAFATGELTEAEAASAFACDILAVSSQASLPAVDLVSLRERAGATVDAAIDANGCLAGSALLRLGLAAFAIEAEVEAATAAVLRLADTIAAIVRARPRSEAQRPASAIRPFAVEHDGARRILTIRLHNHGVPSFTVPLLEAMEALFEDWRRSAIDADTLIFTSATPSIFSMGGDLTTIAALARNRDAAALRHYAHVSARVVHALWHGLGRDVVTIGAVDGKAFGAGFEAITACLFAVAGADATLAFPEARFGLFPGMGATSLVGRRASPGLSEALILSGRKLSAADALAIGAIDAVAERDTAEAHALRTIAARTPAGAARRREALARRQSQPYPLTEAIAVVDVWVDAVLDLTEARLLEIERIAHMQLARYGKKKESTKR